MAVFSTPQKSDFVHPIEFDNLFRPPIEFDNQIWPTPQKGGPWVILDPFLGSNPKMSEKNQKMSQKSIFFIFDSFWFWNSFF